jgi:hypothetical protein
VSADFKNTFQRSAREIARLIERVNETAARRHLDAASRDEWLRACKEFHGQYHTLAFPGGFDAALERLEANDADTIEAVLCFLEVRPYFFRSGYMYTAFMRRIKRAKLTSQQSMRLAAVRKREVDYREKRRQSILKPPHAADPARDRRPN